MAIRHPKADENARQGFQQKKQQYEKEGKPIVFIYESGFSHDAPRTHGYSPKGQRCFGLKNWGARGRTNVIGALLGTTLFAIGLFDININSDVFYAWVTQVLIPVLPKNSVIMMDNATFHKKHNIQQVIIDAGYMVEYLPTYSPDLNPIEHKWAQAKSKKQKKRDGLRYREFVLSPYGVIKIKSLGYIGALLGTTLFAIGLFDININSDVFYAWVTQVLIPVLPKNSVIMMDNATFHKKHNIQQVIIDAGYMVEYLPTYSPDLNPIEHKWAQAKSKKREMGCDTESLFSVHMV
ncbi:IS630 family transposase [Symbiopectobacterium purcellii]|uniref:IS630 family transposase n=3 Tax=Symbiopectobacterium purcellii TaxID=2871826 RepID=UPI003F83C763